MIPIHSDSLPIVREALHEACEHVGSAKKLAELLGISPAMVSAWTSDDPERYRPVAADRCVAIEELTGVSRKRLRPADWRRFWHDHVKSSSGAGPAEVIAGDGRHATISAVENAVGRSFSWRSLKRWCDDHGEMAVEIACPRYGVAQAFPSDAWGEIYGIDIEELFPDNGSAP